MKLKDYKDRNFKDIALRIVVLHGIEYNIVASSLVPGDTTPRRRVFCFLIIGPILSKSR